MVLLYQTFADSQEKVRCRMGMFRPNRRPVKHKKAAVIRRLLFLYRGYLEEMETVVDFAELAAVLVCTATTLYL